MTVAGEHHTPNRAERVGQAIKGGAEWISLAAMSVAYSAFILAAVIVVGVIVGYLGGTAYDAIVRAAR